MSNVHNPLLLVEVVLVVANFVNPKEAVAPSFVCRAWYAVFKPLVWQTCDISDDRLFPGEQPPGQKRPRPEDMVQNAHNIRELICNGSSFSNFEIPCSRLRTLRFHNVIYASRPQWWSQLTQLLVQNDHLETVDFDGTREASTLGFWEALISRPALKYVRMNSVSMSAEQFAIFWNGCRGLRQMELYDIKVPCTSEFIEEQLETLPGLEAITISHLAATALLRLCPGLRFFRWQNYDFGGNAQQLQMLAFLLERQHFPHLESLQVTQVDDLELATCLGAMGRVKELVMDGSILGLQSFGALKRHFDKLQRISLEYVFPISSKRILDVLESCPLLKYIRAPKLNVSAIMRGKPWVCLDLEEFRVGILAGVSGKATIHSESQAVFERLSKLTRLTHLDIGFHYMQDDNSDSDDSNDSDGDNTACQGLDLTLESGFSQLSTLKNLEELDFTYTVQDMSVEDVKWMRDNLKKLQVVKGICNRHGEYCDQPEAKIL